MKPEDNIKQFFEKRLQDTSPADDLWNVPSDDLWNSAKEHFPKKKRKRRPFIFFMLGLGILLLGIVAIRSWEIQTAKPLVKKVEQVSSIVIDEKGSDNKSNALPTENKEQPIAKVKPTVLSKNEKKLATIKTKSKTKAVQQEAIDIADTKITSNKSYEVETIPSIDIEKNIARQTAKNESHRTAILALTPLPKITAFVQNEKVEEAPKMIYKILKPKRKLHRWEVGLSHSPFILNIKKALVEEDGSDEKINVDFRYRNINLPVTRWFNPKWSLTSGISYSQLKLGLNFEVEEVYELVPTDEEFRKILDDNAPSGQLSINDLSEEFEINFTADADLQDGDTLFVDGGIPLTLNVIQVPLVLNYHFGKGKLEGLIHTGIALNYFDTRLQNIEFDIYKNNNLISEPIIFDPVRDRSVDFSLYFGAGIKYHLSDRINLGFSTKLDFTGLLLSRHEIGLYYGF